MGVELDTLIVLEYGTFYRLLKLIEEGKKTVDELVDALLNEDIDLGDDATPES